MKADGGHAPPGYNASVLQAHFSPTEPLGPYKKLQLRQQRLEGIFARYPTRETCAPIYASSQDGTEVDWQAKMLMMMML